MKAPANKTTWLSIGLAAFLLGLGLAKVFHPDTSVYMFALSIALFLFIVSKRFGVAMIASVLILSGVVGNAYGQTYHLPKLKRALHFGRCCTSIFFYSVFLLYSGHIVKKALEL